MSRYNDHYIPSAVSAAPADTLSITFLGNTNLLISDAQTSILTDGYFTRPGRRSAFFGVHPDPETTDDILNRNNISKLDYVIPLHAHFDHAMDSPYVAEQTGAILVGDNNIRQINIGWQKSELREAHYTEFNKRPVAAVVIDTPELQGLTQCSSPNSLCSGEFKITFFNGNHFDNLFDKKEIIANPVGLPAGIFDFTRNDSEIVFIDHPEGKILIIGSAAPLKNDFLESDLLGDIDVVFIAAPGMTKMDTKKLKELQRIIFSAKLVVPFHWDDFFNYSSNDAGQYALKPSMWIVDNRSETLKSMDSLCGMSKTVDTEFGLMTFEHNYSVSQLIAYEAPETCSK